MPEVLIVDDDQSVRDLLTMYFEKDQFTVRTAANGDDALAAVAQSRPDLVILDIMMPGKDGYEVCRELRAHGSLPIIFLTARDDEIEPIVGLEMGADDYVTKPFNAREVVARARAVLRRAQGKAEEAPQQALSFPQFEINPTTREARIKGQRVPLTPHEFDIVYLLCTRPRQVFPRAEIMTTIWGYDPDYGDYRTVDTHLKRARQKLREAGMTECAIETVWGIGYRFVPPES
ncbi:MAG: response regulator transcription factor [Armatimonadetes bacterium]|nr:response regulator transcription factor [Armatimonadota bacterium]